MIVNAVRQHLSAGIGVLGAGILLAAPVIASSPQPHHSPVTVVSPAVQLDGLLLPPPQPQLGADFDIEALAFIVLSEAAASAENDLQTIMDNVQAINAQKAALRNIQDAVNRFIASLQLLCSPCAATGDISRQDQIYLQESLDQKSKIETVISKAVKAVSNTGSSIISNLKDPVHPAPSPPPPGSATSSITTPVITGATVLGSTLPNPPRNRPKLPGSLNTGDIKGGLHTGNIHTGVAATNTAHWTSR